MTETRKRVLFVCTHNSCRSRMAEGFLRALAGDRIDAYSAGVEPTEVHPLAVQTMAEAGVDIGRQRSKHIEEFLGREHFDHVFFVCDHAYQACPTIYIGFGTREAWPFEDPARYDGSDEDKLAKFRDVRDQIRNRIVQWLKEMDEIVA